MFSQEQSNLIQFLNENKSPTLKEVKKKFHTNTINSLTKGGIITIESKSRLRTDDMETIHWEEVSLTKNP